PGRCAVEGRRRARGARDVPPSRRDRATGRRPGALGPQRPRLRRGGLASALGAERGRRPTPHRASQEALDGLGERDPGLRARLLARLAINLYWAPEPERVLALSEEAVTLARQLGDPRDLAAVLRARWIALWRPEAAEERL